MLGIIKHSQGTQSNEFTISLPYLKKNSGMEFMYLHANKHQSFYKLTLLFLTEEVKHVQSTQDRKLVMFLQCIEKKLPQLLLCSVVMQNIQIFYGGPVMFVVTCFFLIIGFE